MFKKLFKRKPKQHGKIRVISTSLMGSFFAVGEFENKIQVWRTDGVLIQNFETDLEAGNRESISVSRNGELLVVAGCDANRLTLFDIVSGKTLWQKSDVKKPYKVRFIERESNKIFVDTENKGCYLLSRETGEILERLKGIKDIKESPYSDLLQLEKTAMSSLMDQNSKTETLKIEHRKDLLNSAFTNNLLVCSYVGGPIEGLHIATNEILWSTASKGHFLRVGYNPEINKILATRWDYEKGGSKFLVYIDPLTGSIEREIDLMDPIAVEFIRNGEFAVTSQGKLYSTKDGKIVNEFDFENN